MITRLFCRVVLTVAAVVTSLTNPAHAEAAADGIVISGTAAYRQRIAMPPDAVLTVRIEDVSRADAKAIVLAEAREVFGDRQVPIPFVLTVPRSGVDARARYAIRATITVGGELRFTTDSHIPVLGAGAAEKHNLLLIATSKPSVGGAPPAGIVTRNVAFTLPVSFAGVLPCADCAGVAQTLTLRADGLYRLRRTYLGKPGGPISEVGRWAGAAEGSQVVLGSGDDKQQFAVVDAATLRQLDRLGQPIRSPANLSLRRLATLDAITESLHWRGQLVYFADAASFTDCASGLRWPVAADADYLEMERRYTKLQSKPGSPLLVSFDGHLDARPPMEGPPREHMVIDRFANVQSGADCARPPPASKATASLKDTYWKLIELDGKAIVMTPAQSREIRITLDSSDKRAFGFSGCNQFTGSYQHEGERLRFAHMAGTMMACPAHLMELEAQVLKGLGATTAYRIDDERLTLLTGNQVIVRFDAVYLH